MFGVRAKGGTTLLTVDSTNSVVKAGVGQFNALTQYAYFGVNYADFSHLSANTDTQYASQIVPCMWFVPDNISIDSVTSIEGADNATGDTTRMHLKSFTFNSGSTSCLTGGELLAHNSDVTNAGNEQAYKSTWTIDSASVTSGKVILAFLRSDSVNSDYSVNITVKYHLV